MKNIFLISAFNTMLCILEKFVLKCQTDSFFLIFFFIQQKASRSVFVVNEFAESNVDYTMLAFARFTFDRVRAMHSRAMHLEVLTHQLYRNCCISPNVLPYRINSWRTKILPREIETAPLYKDVLYTLDDFFIIKNCNEIYY